MLHRAILATSARLPYGRFTSARLNNSRTMPSSSSSFFSSTTAPTSAAAMQMDSFTKPMGAKPSTLYVVAVPIGCLRDITLRALDILRTVDVVLCEDTRNTRALLNAHFGEPSAAVEVASSVPSSFSSSSTRSLSDGRDPPSHPHRPLLLSYTPSNADKRTQEVLDRLVQRHQSIALVSDAGTPCISDPGTQIVRAVRMHQFQQQGKEDVLVSVDNSLASTEKKKKILTQMGGGKDANEIKRTSEVVHVVPIPGVNAAITALSASGWDIHAHYYHHQQLQTKNSGTSRSGSAASGYNTPHQHQRRKTPFLSSSDSDQHQQQQQQDQSLLLPHHSDVLYNDGSQSEGIQSLSERKNAVTSTGFLFLGYLPDHGETRQSLLDDIAGGVEEECVVGEGRILRTTTMTRKKQKYDDLTVVLYVGGSKLVNTLRDLEESFEKRKKGNKERGQNRVDEDDDNDDKREGKSSAMKRQEAEVSSSPKRVLKGRQARLAEKQAKQQQQQQKENDTAFEGIGNDDESDTDCHYEYTRPVLVCRELTKMHEEFKEYGSVKEAHKAYSGRDPITSKMNISGDGDDADGRGVTTTAAAVEPEVAEMRGEFTLLLGRVVVKRRRKENKHK